MNRKIPATMATQHPDNAHAAFWNGKRFIDTLAEIEECKMCFEELGCTEYMWDWEGKFVDEAVIEKFYQRYHDFFQKKQLGKDIFLTFRIPNADHEQNFRLARAYMAILTADDIAQEIGLNAPPIFEVILPMTERAEQLMNIKRTFHQFEQFKQQAFRAKRAGEQEFHVIPLMEGVNDLFNCNRLLDEYIELYRNEYKKPPPYIRPFMARSDPALNAGVIPAVLSAKVALEHFERLSRKHGVPMFPIIGPGCLPFRGGVNPETIAETIKEYSGIRTITIQSAFRYDYPLEQVKGAIKLIEESLPELQSQRLLVNDSEITDIAWVNDIFGKLYQRTVEQIAPLVNSVAKSVPARRERMLHIGLFGYARGVGAVKLPRAITYTSALYSIGVPPEFIASGRGLRQALKEGKISTVEKHYQNLRADFIHAGKFLNKENLQLLAKKNSAFTDIAEDVRVLEEYLGVELGPLRTKHFIHRNLTSSIYLNFSDNEPYGEDLEKAAELRKSMG